MSPYKTCLPHTCTVYLELVFLLFCSPNSSELIHTLPQNFVITLHWCNQMYL